MKQGNSSHLGLLLSELVASKLVSNWYSRCHSKFAVPIAKPAVNFLSQNRPKNDVESHGHQSFRDNYHTVSALSVRQVVGHLHSPYKPIHELECEGGQSFRNT